MNLIHLGNIKFYFINKSFVFFRTRLLSEVYSLLADLIEWSDELLLLKLNDINIQINNDEKYKKTAQDLIQAIKVKDRLYLIEKYLFLCRIVFHLHVIHLQVKV